MKPSLSTMLAIDVFPQIFLIFSFSPRTILHCSIEWKKGKVMPYVMPSLLKSLISPLPLPSPPYLKFHKKNLKKWQSREERF